MSHCFSRYIASVTEHTQTAAPVFIRFILNNWDICLTLLPLALLQLDMVYSPESFIYDWEEHVYLTS